MHGYKWPINCTRTCTAELGAAEENLLQQRQRYERELSAQSEAVQQVALACDESSRTLQSLESDLERSRAKLTVTEVMRA